MKWIVTNALSRDVERQHLNKILKEISDAIGDTTSTVETISTVINGSVLKSFTLRLAGDLTGEVLVNGSGVFVLNAALTEDVVEEAPDDGKAYVRKSGAWVLPTTADIQETINKYFTGDRAAEAVVDAINAGVSTGITFTYDSGTIDVEVTNSAAVLDFPNGEAFDLVRGMPVCVVGDELLLATSASPKNKVIGLVYDDLIAPGDTGVVKFSGLLSMDTADWDVVTGGSGGLDPESYYFVNSSGELTTTQPAFVDGFVHLLGVSLSATDFVININQISEGGGSTSGGILPIVTGEIDAGQPVFVIGPDGSLIYGAII